MNTPTTEAPAAHECEIGADGFCHNYKGHEAWLVCRECKHRGLIMVDSSRDLDSYPDILSCPNCRRQNIEAWKGMAIGTKV